MKTLYIYLFTSVLFAFPLLGYELSDEPKKAKARMSFEYFKTPNEQYLKVRVKTKIEKKYKPVADVGVSIYLATPLSEILIGKIITGEDGFGVLLLGPSYFSVADSLMESNFLAVMDVNPNFLDLKTDLTIRKAQFNVEYIDHDSVKFVQANISEMNGAGLLIPQEYVEIKFFVERPLGQLPVGGDYTSTDEDGNVSIDFPTDLPGDIDGNVKVIVKIVDNENYGNVEKSKILKWGIPTRIDDDILKRSLWASGANAPILLLLIVNGLILATWGILIFIVARIYTISKI